MYNNDNVDYDLRQIQLTFLFINYWQFKWQMTSANGHIFLL
jgi:hypothetical protein